MNRIPNSRGIFSKVHNFTEFRCAKRAISSKNDILVYSDEVTEAKKNGLPIVALESTIITHGMPYPDNLETALRLERTIRKQGAVPATISILHGKIHIGTNPEGIERLSLAGNKRAVKCSRRDFPMVVAQRLDGGTTVSGTMLAANLAGIPLMATGGIGGVHRGAELTFDVSADLAELGRTPVAVVCAGVKAILDIPKTLEYLETLGVPVTTIGDSDAFPAFYCCETSDRIKSPFRVSSPAEAANLIRSQRELGLFGGMLLAVPIPPEHSLNPQQVETAIQEALEDAQHQGIRGKDTTPFLLKKLNELTAGRSLQANKALIENNARVAAEIAFHLSVVENKCTATSILPNQSASGWSRKNPVVIGGANMDTVVQLEEPQIKLDGRTHKARSRESCGGVGRNIAAALVSLGVEGTKLLSVVGNDAPGKTIIQSLGSGSVMLEVLQNVQTARYTAVVNVHGECCFGVGEMAAHEAISPALLNKYQSDLEDASLIVIDGNPPPKTIEAAMKIAEHSGIGVWYEPTDVHKATMIFEVGEHWKSALHFISPNINELLAIAQHFEVPIPKDTSNLDLETIQKIAHQLAGIIPVVITTLGPRGLMVSRKASQNDPFYDEEGKLIENSNGEIQSHFYQPISSNSSGQGSAVSASGCGDCLVAGMIRGILDGLDEASCVSLALQAASLSLVSPDPVPFTLSMLRPVNIRDGKL